MKGSEYTAYIYSMTWKIRCLVFHGMGVVQINFHGFPLHMFLMFTLKRWLMLFLLCSFGTSPLKHGHIHGQKLPASTGPLWWHLTVDGDAESIWPGAKPGEKLGAAFPRARWLHINYKSWCIVMDEAPNSTWSS